MFNRDIIFTSFNSEEMEHEGSKYFVDKIKNKYSSLYNINIECIGGKKSGKISLNNKSKISNKLTEAMKETFRNNNMEFSNVALKNLTSDHMSFENEGFHNICIRQEHIYQYIHEATDTPDTLDSNEINEVAKVICDFIEKNDGNDFTVQ